MSQQRRAYLERLGSNRNDQDLVVSAERSSSTCVPSNQLESSHRPVESHAGHTSPPARSTAKHDEPDQSPNQRHVPFFRYWKWEILSIVSSLALLTGVLATLARYNGGKQPEWPYGINVNSLISVLTAVIISQLGFILAELISQLKWSWFRESHPLQDLEHYDSASRGILGSLIFLGRFARQPRAGLALAAASIFLMSAAIGPFTQQSIKSYPCQQPVHDSNIRASIAAANYVNPSLVVGKSAEMYRYPDFKMMSSILEGIVGSADNSRTVPFNCSTGDCIFDPYSSLAYCSSCTDITSHVQEQHTRRDSDSDDLVWNYNVTLPDQECHLGFADSGGHPVLSTPINGSSGNSMNIVLCSKPAEYLINHTEHRSTTSFTIMSTSWANCSHDHDDGYPDSPGCGGYPEQLPSLANQSGLVAMSCTLGLCVREYSGSVHNGELNESTTSSIAAGLIPNEVSMLKILKLPCTVDSNKYDLSNISQVSSIPGRKFTTVSLGGQNVTVPLECVFSTGEDVPWAISQFFQTELCKPTGFQDGQKGGCAFILTNKSSLCHPWYFEPFFRGGRPTAATIASDVENIAVAISNRMRTVGSNAYMNGSGVALGTAMETTVCVRVDWPWLVFPAALVLLTVVLFVTVLIKARRSQISDGQPIWKSSAVVAFFNGIDARCRTSAPTSGGIAGPVTSAHEPGNLPASCSLLRVGSHEDLITLDGMHDKAKKVVVKLETAATGKGGFIVVNEQDDERRANPNKHHAQRRPSESRYGGEALPLTRLSSNGSRLTPSLRDSLDRSIQRGHEDS